MLRPFGDGLLIAPGDAVSVAGFPYPTRMAVLRLGDGGLAVWSPVRLTPARRAAVSALGPVRRLIAPNALHHLFLADWAAAFPGAEIHAAPGLAARRPDLKIAAELSQAPDPGWGGAVEVALFRGNLITTEAALIHRPSRTALFCDLLQRIDPATLRGWRRAVARLDLMCGAEPAVPRKFRLAFVRRAPARAALARVLEAAPERVLMAHGDPVARDGTAFLRRAFAFLGD